MRKEIGGFGIVFILAACATVPYTQRNQINVMSSAQEAQ